jgi:cytochrome c
MRHLTLGAVLALAAVPAFAEGDAAAGEEQFARQCVACHVIATPAGEVLAGRNARTGPNLFGIVGEAPGAVEDFDFSDALIDWGAAGAVWDEETLVGYIMNPTRFVREQLGNDRARVKMAFQVRDEQDAHDIFAYLESLQPAE